MRHRHFSPTRRRKRRMLVERLEVRTMLDGEGLPWLAPNLTISFAPDGTDVAGRENTLFQSLDVLGASPVWQAAIMQGFNTWTPFISASVATAPDNGEYFGSPGPTQGDARFGDVRVAAIPMPNDIIAMSVPHDEVISGTWAGDILFNSNASLNSIDDILAIAVHEAGHVLGLGHSTDPNSPMFEHGITSVLSPTPADINTLQRLYGVAQNGGATDGGGNDGNGNGNETETEHDREHGDDQLITANGLVLSANFQGAIRYDATGQIFDATDVDFYQLAPIDDAFEQADVLTVTVSASTSEGLIPSAVILDDRGRVVESTVLTNANGEFVLQAKGVDPRLPHFVEVKAAADANLHATGGYTFVAKFGVRETTFDRLTHGTLTPDQPTSSTVLHVSETRLVYFVFATDPADTATSSIAWTAIYDSNGNPVFRAAAHPGETRSANTLLLTPDDYQVEFHNQTPDGAAPAKIDYRLLSRSISLPVGPGAIDPTRIPILPCSTPGADPLYCYAGAATPADPFIFPIPPPIVFPDPIVPIAPPWLDPANWYWDGVAPPSNLPAPIGTAPPIPNGGNNGGANNGGANNGGANNGGANNGGANNGGANNGGANNGGANNGGANNGGGNSAPNSPTTSWQNFLYPQDVDADQSVSVVDVLLVISFLREGGPRSLASERPQGSPFLDVDNDGFASINDVLLVVSELRQSLGAAGEGGALVAASVPANATPPLLVATAQSNVQSSQSSPKVVKPQKSVALPQLPRTPNAANTTAASLAVTANTVAANTVAANTVANARLVKRPLLDQTLENAIAQIAPDLTSRLAP